MPGRSGETRRTPTADGGAVGGRGVEAGAQPAVEAQHGESRRVPVLLVGQFAARRAACTDRGHGHAVPARVARPGTTSGSGSVEGGQVPAREHAIGCGHERERRRTGRRPAGRLPAGDDAAAASSWGSSSTGAWPGCTSRPAAAAWAHTQGPPAGAGAAATPPARPWPGRANPIGYGMCAPTIATHGTPEQKARYLRPLFTTRRSGASSSASRAPGPTSPASRPEPSATATSGCSTGRRCGPRWRTFRPSA